MGSTQEIHDREREFARLLLIRIARHLRDHEMADVGEPTEEDGGFVRSLQFHVGTIPLKLHLHVQP
jgi:hypothetical protein